MSGAQAGLSDRLGNVPRDGVAADGVEAHSAGMREAAFHIMQAETAEDLAAVARLFGAYVASLDVDLTYQGFAEELAGLPGDYAPTRGRLLLARGAARDPLGCVALRPMSFAGCCEMKRLFVTPASRGMGLGRALMAAVVREARQIGYREMRLDTLPSMHAAQAMYREAGFQPIPAYYETPVEGTVFLALDLAAERAG